MSKIDVSKYSDLKVTIPAVLLLGVFAIGWRVDHITADYIDNSLGFVTDAEATELSAKTRQEIEKLSSKIDGITRTFDQYVRRQDVKEINTRIDSKEREIRNLEREIAEHGTNTVLRDQLVDARSVLNMLENEKRCLLDDRVLEKGNCDLR